MREVRTTMLLSEVITMLDEFKQHTVERWQNWKPSDFTVDGEPCGRTDKEWELLKEDIRANGIREPLIITENPPGRGLSGKFFLDDGVHRIHAAYQLNLTVVPVEILYLD